MKLKTKLVLMSVAVSSLMCLAVTVSAMNSAQEMLTMVAIVPALQTASSISPTSPTQGDAQTMVSSASIQQDYSQSVGAAASDAPPAADGSIAAADTTPAATAVAAQRTFRMGLTYVMLAIIVGGALCTWLFAGRILRPLERLTQQVRETRPETLAQPMAVPQSGDEVGRLGQAFSEMTAQVGTAYNLQKSFAASAAHELRTPLSVLNAEVDVYCMQPQHTAPEQAEFAHTVKDSTQRLTALVEDLLSMTNQSTLVMDEPVDMRLLLDEIVFELTQKAAAKEISLSVTGDTFTVTGNDSLLQRAFYNLAENAIKYTQRGGSVALALSARTVQVRDTGYGVPDADKAFIFEPFYRAEKSRNRSAGGSGLGLAIVRQIVVQHGGSIAVADNAPQGSVFTVTL